MDIRQIRLSFERGGFIPPRNVSYLLYGSLCERLPPDLADVLHEQAITPFSAYSHLNGKTLEWTVSSFGELGAEVLDCAKNLKSIELSKLNTVLNVMDVTESSALSETDFCRKYLVEAAPKKEFTLRFVSPCAFRSGNEYVNLPSKSLILKSIAQRWDSSADEFTLGDDDALDAIIAHCRVTRYRLESAIYPIKGVNIPSFTGELTLTVRGPEPLMRITNLLLASAEFSGVGIKTALGMGGVQIK
jgi:CRISPR-associated endoribonuclease Cas6